jgi:hypothetical protein
MIAYTVSFSATPRMAKSVPAPDLIFTFTSEQRKYCVYSTTGVGGVDELEEFKELDELEELEEFEELDEFSQELSGKVSEELSSQKELLSEEISVFSLLEAELQATKKEPRLNAQSSASNFFLFFIFFLRMF